MGDLGYIDWWEFSPVNDLMLCKIVPTETEQKTESGILIQTQTSVVEDRPSQGVVMAKGPDAPHDVGTFLFWTKTGGYDQHQIRKSEDDQYYTLINPETILGVKIKDSRGVKNGKN